MHGDPGTLLGLVTDLDDPQVGTFLTAYPGTQGPLSFSLPEGHYSVEFSVFTGPADDLTNDMAVVIKPEIALDSDMTVTMDARTAVPYQPKLQTPPPAGYARQDILAFDRESPTGSGFKLDGGSLTGLIIYTDMRLYSNSTTGNKPLLVTPTAPVTEGTFQFSAFTTMGATEADSQGEPRCQLAFPSENGVPKSLTYDVPDSALTPVHSTIHASPCACSNTMILFPTVFLPWDEFELSTSNAVPAGELTDYWYSSAPDLTIWQDSFNSDDGIRHNGERRTITPGQSISETWNNTTFGPSPEAEYADVHTFNPTGSGRNVTDLSGKLCAMCRQGDIAEPYINVLGDASQGHSADVSFPVNSSLEFWRDGVLAMSTAAQFGGQLYPDMPLPLLHKAATYKLKWAWSIHLNPQATSDTTWTFRSDPADSGPAPSGDEKCAPDPDQACSFLPLMFVTYDLPVDLHSQAKAGASFPLSFTVSGQQGAPAPTGVSASVSVSYDDGKTWSDPQDANDLGGGKFGLTIDHPDLAATSGFVSLRVQAHDAAGNTVDQTSVRDYRLTS